MGKHAPLPLPPLSPLSVAAAGCAQTALNRCVSKIAGWSSQEALASLVVLLPPALPAMPPTSSAVSLLTEEVVRWNGFGADERASFTAAAEAIRTHGDTAAETPAQADRTLDATAFEILRVVGQGAFGKVRRGRRHRLQGPLRSCCRRSLRPDAAICYLLAPGKRR